jgi:hypothetical protein
VNLRVRRNVARMSGLALVAVALVLFAQTGAASADGQGATLKQKGWWWEAQQLPTGTIPPPPNVKQGQLNVQGSPGGKTAFAAVHYDVASGESVSALTLKVGANGATNGDAAALLACRTGSAWSPADGGQWSAAPKVDTTACVNGQKSADGQSWTFNVSTLQTGSVVDVAIVPGVDATTKQPATFSLTFDAPTNDSLATAAGSTSSAGSTFNSGTSAAESPALSGSGAVSPSPSGVGVHPPVPPSVPTGLPADKVGQTATAPAKQAASQPGLDSALNATTAAAKQTNKTAGWIVLALAILVGLYAYRQDNLLARNGGVLPGAEEEVGGLGRFAKPRSGQPPALT